MHKASQRIESGRVSSAPGIYLSARGVAQKFMYGQLISTSYIFPGPSSQDSVCAWANFKAIQGKAFH